MQICLKENYNCGSVVVPAGTVVEVYAVMGVYAWFCRKLRLRYLVCWPEYDAWCFFDEKCVKIVDGKPSRHWIEVKKERNQKVYSWAIDESVGIRYAYYHGPKILMMPHENLLRVACSERYMIQEVIWEHKKANAQRRITRPSTYWGAYCGWRKE